VYEAVRTGQDGVRVPVALKVLRERPELLREEGRLGSLLRHQHLVDVLEVGEDQGRWFCAFELCPGGSLSRYAPLPPRAVVDVGLAVCAALDYAHDALGLVHQDLKPDNLLLLDDVVKVGDLGHRPRRRVRTGPPRRGHPRVHAARAGCGPTGRRARRPLRARGDPGGARHRPTSARHHHVLHPRRRGQPGVGRRSRGAWLARPRRHPVPRRRPRGPVAVGEGVGRRPAVADAGGAGAACGARPAAPRARLARARTRTRSVRGSRGGARHARGGARPAGAAGRRGPRGRGQVACGRGGGPAVEQRPRPVRVAV
jgi:hypothetical protein